MENILLLFSLPVVSDSLQPHGLQQAGPPCLLPSPEVCPSSCPLHQWCHPAISSSDALFSFCPQSFTASGTFSVSFSISASSEYSGLMPLKIDWFALLAVQRTLKNLLQHLSSKASILSHSVFFAIQLSLPYMTAGKTTALIMWAFVGRVVSAF